jgi:hypothetical protein
MSKQIALSLGRTILSGLSTAASSNYNSGFIPMLRRGINYGIRGRTRQGNIITTRTNRRNQRRRNRKGMEINRAEGGYKNITLPYRMQSIGINTYGRLAIVKVGDSWNYAFQPQNDNYANHEEYNIMTMLNDSTEFKDRLKTTSQYKVESVSIAIFNERIPEGGDKLSRLLAYVNTTKVSVLQPKIQNNVMRLNMNSIGTKLYNFRLTDESIGKDFTGWFDGDDLYTGNVYLHVQSEDINIIKDTTETTVILGTVKITFHVLTRIQDYVRNNEPQKKLTESEKIKNLQEEINKVKTIIKQGLEV